jgi:hypothetical protein
VTGLILILQKLESLDELKEIVYSLRDGEAELKDRFDGLSIAVGKLEGDLSLLSKDSIRSVFLLGRLFLPPLQPSLA